MRIMKYVLRLIWTTIGDILYIVLSILNCILFKILKLKELREQSEWFWMKLAIFLMTAVTFLIEISVLDKVTVSDSIIADLIKTYTAINVFLIFCLRREVYESLFSNKTSRYLILSENPEENVFLV